MGLEDGHSRLACFRYDKAARNTDVSHDAFDETKVYGPPVSAPDVHVVLECYLCLSANQTRCAGAAAEICSLALYAALPVVQADDALYAVAAGRDVDVRLQPHGLKRTELDWRGDPPARNRVLRPRFLLRVAQPAADLDDLVVRVVAILRFYLGVVSEILKTKKRGIDERDVPLLVQRHRVL